MNGNTGPDIAHYHAHVYYDAETRERAARLRQAIEARFNVCMGRWHDRPIGPHPCSSYQVKFAPDLFGAFIPWLALNRDGLAVLIHPRTGDDMTDHTDFAMWMGEKVEIDVDALG
jgi:DOPA 4,5-dioxygenase